MPAPVLLRGDCDAATLRRLARKAKDGKAMDKAKAGRRKKNPSRDPRGLQPSKTLSDLSISYDQSSHWQQLADKALWLWGRLRDFKREGILDEESNTLFLNMTAPMQEDTLCMAPLVIKWLQRFENLA